MVKSISNITAARPHRVQKCKLIWVTTPLLHSPPPRSLSLAMPCLFRVGLALSSGSCVLDSTICPAGDNYTWVHAGPLQLKLVCCPLLVLHKPLKDREAVIILKAVQKRLGRGWENTATASAEEAIREPVLL